jgi:hypothetical protein
MTNSSIKVEAVASHRNGMAGAPFHTVLFTDENGPMLGIVFKEQCHVAVLHRDKLAKGDIAFRSNSWRGDLYEAELRQAIRAFEATRQKEVEKNLQEELTR